MSEIQLELLIPIASSIIGGTVTAIVWLGRLLYNLKSDVDHAHRKIRAIEKHFQLEGYEL